MAVATEELVKPAPVEETKTPTRQRRKKVTGKEAFEAVINAKPKDAKTIYNVCDHVKSTLPKDGQWFHNGRPVTLTGRYAAEIVLPDGKTTWIRRLEHQATAK